MPVTGELGPTRAVSEQYRSSLVVRRVLHGSLPWPMLWLYFFNFIMSIKRICLITMMRNRECARRVVEKRRKRVSCLERHLFCPTYKMKVIHEGCTWRRCYYRPYHIFNVVSEQRYPSLTITNVSVEGLYARNPWALTPYNLFFIIIIYPHPSASRRTSGSLHWRFLQSFIKGSHAPQVCSFLKPSVLLSRN